MEKRHLYKRYNVY